MIKILNAQDKNGYELIYGYYDILAELPDNCTNGDMVMAMFPDGVKSNYIESDSVMSDYVTIYLGDYEMKVSYDWWVAPFKMKSC